ncbi:MAG: hypothetical protein CMO26_17415 [Thiotrichales bacterium]|nr:hypothetical protein [Thiotrichales bacterium]
MNNGPLTPAQCRTFHQQGFLHLPAVMNPQSMLQLNNALQTGGIEFRRIGSLEWAGWTDPGDDLLGQLSRFEALVDTAAQLLGEECYHWHTKIVRKPPHCEEQLDWHQDFGSWYKDGCLEPTLVTAVLAVTEANQDNGGLRFLAGSHHLGRLDRLREGVEDYAYFSLNATRLAAIEQRYERICVALAPGDVLLFHCNLLHSSGPNRTADARVLFEVTYNALNNGPVFDDQAFHAPRPMAKAAAADLDWHRFAPLGSDTRIIDLNDPEDPGIGIFRRKYDPGLC